MNCDLISFKIVLNVSYEVITELLTKNFHLQNFVVS